MLPQITGIPLPANDSSASSSNTVALNRALPVGQNVSATVVAVSRDQIQPDIFRLRLEVNNRLIQLGVFQPLPLGQKINVTRLQDGQIQLILPQSGSNSRGQVENQPPPANNPPAQKPDSTAPARQQNTTNLPLLRLVSGQNTASLPLQQAVTATVISSRQLSTSNDTPVSNRTATTTITSNSGSRNASSQVVTSGNSPEPAPTVGRAPQTSIAAQPATQPPASVRTSAEQGQSAITLVRGENPAVAQSSNTNTPPAESRTTPSATQPTAQSNFSTASEAPRQTPTQPAASTPQSSTAPTAGETQTAASRAAEGILRPPTTRTTQPVTPQTTAPTTSNTIPGNIQPATGNQPGQHLINLLLPDGRQIQVLSSRPLPQGSELQLQRTGQTAIQTTGLNRATEPPPSALDRPVVKQTLREVLPQQLPVADAFNQLAQLASRSDSGQATQLTGVVRSLLQLFGVRPGSPEAAGQIRQNVELGGLSTESNMGRGLQPPPAEMKQQLQQLARLSEKLPPEQRERLEQLVRGLHSRVTSQQLNSLQQWRELPDGSFERVLQLDIPVRNGERWENLELRLSREAHHSSTGEMITQWRVRLHFDLEQWGGLDAEIRLTDNHQISALFWCEKPETTVLLQQQADNFAERLRQCGFNETEINSQQGKAPTQHSPVHKELIDLHT